VADVTVEQQNANVFEKNAAHIANARWTELYPTGLSTVVYLNAPLLKQLSHNCAQQPNQNLDWEPNEAIPVAVTINRQTQACTTVFGARGIRIATDQNGDCVHLAGLLT
jgi:hypothetical protein